jgi:hypothetical protein
MMASAAEDVRALAEDMPEALVASRAPYLIGVRHHSVACALAMPALLEDAAPARIYLEMPAELEPWIRWVGHPETEGPVALASVVREELVSFYPLATFSPERVAIRWAIEHGVEVVAFDSSAEASLTDQVDATPPVAALNPLDGSVSALWARAVEARLDASPEDIRRAALRVGWAVRVSGTQRPRDQARETYMRSRLEELREGTVAIVGAYHAAALLDTPLHFSPRASAPRETEPVTSLVAYDHTLLDERSGYPAGILDPAWHEALFDAVGEGRDVADVLREQATRLVRHARSRGHVGSTAAAYEMVRIARGLARLRRQPHPTNVELTEAARSVLGAGGSHAFDLLLATAFVGRSVGKIAKDAPRSGLVSHVEDVAIELRLPQRGEPTPKELRLDVLRSDLDRKRHLALTRAEIAAVRWGEERKSQAAGRIETLQRIWNVAWTPGTDASLAFAGRYGVTLAQAATGALREDARRAESSESLDAPTRIRLLSNAFAAGLPTLGAAWLDEWHARWTEDAGLPALLAFVALLRRLEAGHEPGFDPEAMPELAPRMVAEADAALLHADAVLAGLGGSDDIEDARALSVLVQQSHGGDRLRLRLEAMREEGSPLMQGAAWGASLLSGFAEERDAAAWIGSWITRADGAEAREWLARGLAGLFAGSGSLLEIAGVAFLAIVERVEALADRDFLGRLPALRRGFSVLSKAERQRFIRLLEDRGAIDAAAMDRLPIDPDSLAHYAALDQEAAEAARAALGAHFPNVKSDAEVEQVESVPENGANGDGLNLVNLPADERHLAAGDRWRLILGRERERLSRFAGRVSLALGGGPGGDDGSGQGAGTGAARPAIREWLGELEALFGVDVCQEIVADRAEKRPHLVTELDAEAARPSVELLTSVLSMAGHLGEADLARVRPLVKRIIDQLTRELATQIAPALFGARSARPTRRPSARLDLARTVRKNLHTARHDGDGGFYLVPEHAIFRVAEKRRLTWEVFILLDVSGSMEPSIVHTALMAGILAGVPWVDLSLYGFSTEVVDLSEHVEDPMKLLLEVHVGGGTDIGGAVRFVEEKIVNPRRSMLLVVSDFEEIGTGQPLLQAVARLREAGVRTLGIASLDERGGARFNVTLARQLDAVGMPVAAVSPTAVARWMKEQLG